MTSWVVGLRRSSKALPKAKLAPKKKSWSLFGGLLPVWSTTAFWISAKPLHLRGMLSKSTRCTENCNACSRHWSSKWAQFFMTMPPEHHTTNASKVEWNVLQGWPHLSHSPDLLPTNYHCFKPSRQLFARKMLPQPAGRRKRFPRVRWIPKHRFLCYRNKQTYFSLAKMCWL